MSAGTPLGALDAEYWRVCDEHGRTYPHDGACESCELALVKRQRDEARKMYCSLMAAKLGEGGGGGLSWDDGLSLEAERAGWPDLYASPTSGEPTS